MAKHHYYKLLGEILTYVFKIILFSYETNRCSENLWNMILKTLNDKKKKKMKKYPHLCSKYVIIQINMKYAKCKCEFEI